VGSKKNVRDAKKLEIRPSAKRGQEPAEGPSGVGRRTKQRAKIAGAQKLTGGGGRNRNVDANNGKTEVASPHSMGEKRINVTLDAQARTDSPRRQHHKQTICKLLEGRISYFNRGITNGGLKHRP